VIYLGDCGPVSPAHVTVCDLNREIVVVDKRPSAEHTTCLEVSVERANMRITVDDTEVPPVDVR